MSNGLTPEFKAKALEFVKKIEGQHEELDSLRGEYMAACKDPRQKIRDIIAEAEDKGIDKSVIKALVKERELLERIKAQPNGFNLDQQSQYEQLSASIGAFQDTELGQAALQRFKAESQKSGAAAGTEAQQPKGNGKGKKPKKPKKPKASAAPGTAENTARLNS